MSGTVTIIAVIWVKLIVGADIYIYIYSKMNPIKWTMKQTHIPTTSGSNP